MRYILILLIPLLVFPRERIIALTPAIVEIVADLNKTDELVAIPEHTVYPKNLKKPSIGSGVYPNLEKILSYSPTLVIAQDYQRDIQNKLKQLNIKTISVKLKTINDIKNSIKKIAKNLDADSKPLLKKINDAIAQCQKSKTKHKIMIVYTPNESFDKGVFIAGKDIFYDDIITISGNENIWQNSFISQPVLTYEHILKYNPDIIIILNSNKNTNKQKLIKLYKTLPVNASKNNKVFILDDEFIFYPSSRVYKTVDIICKTINDGV